MAEYGGVWQRYGVLPRADGSERDDCPLQPQLHPDEDDCDHSYNCDDDGVGDEALGS